jgi:predicted PhzF superfamily epimerase YddE/YHI9
MKIPYYQVDVFTDSLFKGNPAGVCLLPSGWLADEVMQNIAFENNLSETAFVIRHSNGYGLRWFTPSIDFLSRFFEPGAGVNEDPVTGSAHSMLIPYWSKRLKKKDLHALQLSARGGELFCQDNEDRVKIGGKAVTYLRGEIDV